MQILCTRERNYACNSPESSMGWRVVILSGEKVKRLRITNLLSAVQNETFKPSAWNTSKSFLLAFL